MRQLKCMPHEVFLIVLLAFHWDLAPVKLRPKSLLESSPESSRCVFFTLSCLSACSPVLRLRWLFPDFVCQSSWQDIPAMKSHGIVRKLLRGIRSLIPQSFPLAFCRQACQHVAANRISCGQKSQVVVVEATLGGTLQIERVFHTAKSDSSRVKARCPDLLGCDPSEFRR